MKQLIEGFVTVFLVILSALVLVQFVGASMQIRTARQFHTTCIGEIEESDFDEDVISMCVEQAKKKGYELNVSYIKEEELVCRGCNSVVTPESAFCPNCQNNAQLAYDREQICEVNLIYSIKMALIKIDKKGELKGFAR